MADLHDRFRALDRLPVPDLWGDASGRTPRPSTPPPSRRFGAAAAAIVLAAGGMAWAAAALLGGSKPPIPIAPATVNGRIAYVVADDPTSDYQISSINPDGTDPVQLTNDSDAWGIDPAWSPDGGSIAYRRQPLTEGATSDIYVMNTDGSDQHVLIHDARSPAWSADGSRIAFTRSSDSGAEAVFTASSDGSRVTQVTRDGPRYVSPTWSPDGARIAYIQAAGGSAFGILDVMNADGTGSPRTRYVGVAEPRWSPVADEIALVAPEQGEGSDGRTYIALLDLSSPHHLTRLTDGTARALSPTWSPDGEEIAFSSDMNGVRQIYTIRRDGSDLRQVTFGDVPKVFPSWGTAPVSNPTPEPGTGTASVLSQDGRFRCTATYHRVVEPGQKPIERMVVENVSGGPMKFAATESTITIADVRGQEVWSGIPILSDRTGGVVIGTDFPEGATRDAPFFQTGIRWDGPLTIRAGCSGLQLPPFRIGVAVPGPVPSDEDAISRALEDTRGIFEACRPTDSGSFVNGYLSEPGMNDATLPARCAAVVERHEGFAVVSLVFVTPPGAPDVDLPQYFISSFQLPSNMEVGRWTFVITSDSVREVEALTAASRCNDASGYFAGALREVFGWNCSA